MIKCLIVDDEPIARNGLIEHINQIDFIHLVADCKSAVEAASWLIKGNIDLIFLDIQMPKLTGIDFVKNASSLPPVIFTTAYPQYAIEGYELDVLDYLLKPISFNRFLKSVLKAQEFLKAKSTSKKHTSQVFFFIKCNQKIEKIIINDIHYIEAFSNYVIIHTKQKKYVVYITFKAIEEQLPKDVFIRIHKSFIVSINAILSIDGNEVFLEAITLPLSKSYKDEMMDRIDNMLFKR
jgi:DNA-binding LytR/AlgR family response regulator